jgi:hypothetical protein
MGGEWPREQNMHINTEQKKDKKNKRKKTKKI